MTQFPNYIIKSLLRSVGKNNCLDMVTFRFLPFVLILKHLNGIYILQC